jgi:type I restriction enzyme S subunit
MSCSTEILSHLCTDISYGYTESADPNEGDAKFLRITDIQGGTVDWNSVPYCPIDEKGQMKYALEDSDIVIARTGNSTGENYLFRGYTNDTPVVFASYLIRYRINPDLANPVYVWYQMRSKRWMDFVLGVKGGSAQAGANAKNLGLFEVELIDRRLQDEAAMLLSDIDYKIATNQVINSTQESIAQAL